MINDAGVSIISMKTITPWNIFKFRLFNKITVSNGILDFYRAHSGTYKAYKIAKWIYEFNREITKLRSGEIMMNKSLNFNSLCCQLKISIRTRLGEPVYK